MKLKGTIPEIPKKNKIVGYAWNIFQDHLDKKTIWYDSQDPEKEKNEEKLWQFSRAEVPKARQADRERIAKILQISEGRAKG